MEHTEKNKQQTKNNFLLADNNKLLTEKNKTKADYSILNSLISIIARYEAIST
ncbi:MAG: hypothetical protein J5I47_05590 [Vicingus serpentipes]|nr:hypothetical protein [Vicingus serpentipes]